MCDPVADRELAGRAGHDHRPAERTAFEDTLWCWGAMGHDASVSRAGPFAPPWRQTPPRCLRAGQAGRPCGAATIGPVNHGPVESENVDPDVDLSHPPHFTGPAGADTWRTMAVVCAGGVIGGLARLAVNTAIPHRGLGFPWATFIENVSGCLLIGVLMVAVNELWPAGGDLRHHLVRPFLGTGILGGFTTFSAYTADSRALFAAGQAGTASIYLAATLTVGLAAVVAGMLATRLALSIRAGR